MSPKPKDLSDSEEEVPVEDGYFPFAQPLELLNNEFNIPEPRVHLDENGQQLLYHPVMYSVRTYWEEIERIEMQTNFCAWYKTKNIVIVLAMFGLPIRSTFGVGEQRI